MRGGGGGDTLCRHPTHGQQLACGAWPPSPLTYTRTSPSSLLPWDVCVLGAFVCGTEGGVGQPVQFTIGPFTALSDSCGPSVEVFQYATFDALTSQQVQAAMVRLSPARCVAIRCVCSVPCRVRWGRVSCYP